MKKYLVGALIFLFTINVEAQWYERKYSVNDINDLNELQLTQALQKAKNNIGLGVALTVIGTGAMIGGIAIINKGRHKDDFFEGFFTAMEGGGIIVLGVIPFAIGVPIWLVNADRKKSIKVALVKFNTTSFLGNNQPTYFGGKQPSTLGLSVKISF